MTETNIETNAETNEKEGQNNKFILLALALVLLVGAAWFGYYKKGAGEKAMVLPIEEAKTKAENFIAENLVQPGTDISITEITEENGLYKIKIDAAGQEASAHISRDGKNFFPQVLDMDNWQNPQNEKQPRQPIETKGVPDVELFVMSYCPYGLQIEKGILPVVQLLGSKINFKLKFVDYLMHGEKEMDENLRQYCIGQKEPSKLAGYLDCFAKTGESASCLKTSAVNSSLLASCASAADAQFGIKEKFIDKSLWESNQFPPFDVDKEANVKYGVAGSPTLVINGTTISSNRDPQSLLVAICSGFSDPPQECGRELSTASPAPGFGEGTGAATNSSCGN